MKWTKRHSQNAIAAKARKRMAPTLADEPTVRCRVPRRSRARFTIQIRDHAVGDSLTLNLHPAPWPNRWVCEAGQFSSAHLGRVVTLILQGGPSIR
jgi:hypothetical protein